MSRHVDLRVALVAAIAVAWAVAPLVLVAGCHGGSGEFPHRRPRAGEYVLHPPILYRTSGGPVPLLEMHRRPALWMAGVAFAGVVGGHTIAYFAAVPDASRRGALLAQTGHSYWRTALVAALLVEVLALAAVAARHFRAGLAIPARGPLPIRLGGFQLAVRLSLIQVAAFTALEVGERLVSRTSPTTCSPSVWRSRSSSPGQGRSCCAGWHGPPKPSGSACAGLRPPGRQGQSASRAVRTNLASASCASRRGAGLRPRAPHESPAVPPEVRSRILGERGKSS